MVTGAREKEILRPALRSGPFYWAEDPIGTYIHDCMRIGPSYHWNSGSMLGENRGEKDCWTRDPTR